MKITGVDVVSTVFSAARNNAEWCDAFCRAHGVAGRFDDDAWWSGVRTPPLHPDAVTLVRRADAGAILARVEAGPGCSVKDSFGDLDLTGDGFEILFRAEWLCLEHAEAPTPAWSVVGVGRRRSRIGRQRGASRPPRARSSVLPFADEAVAVLARHDADRIAAGAVANPGAGVIGLSNVFDGSDDLASAYRDAAGAAQALWGPAPVVGYESGAEREAARQAGFVSIGELAVWVGPAELPTGR